MPPRPDDSGCGGRRVGLRAAARRRPGHVRRGGDARHDGAPAARRPARGCPGRSGLRLVERTTGWNGPTTRGTTSHERPHGCWISRSSRSRISSISTAMRTVASPGAHRPWWWPTRASARGGPRCGAESVRGVGRVPPGVRWAARGNGCRGTSAAMLRALSAHYGAVSGTVVPMDATPHNSASLEPLVLGAGRLWTRRRTRGRSRRCGWLPWRVALAGETQTAHGERTPGSVVSGGPVSQNLRGWMAPRPSTPYPRATTLWPLDSGGRALGMRTGARGHPEPA